MKETKGLIQVYTGDGKGKTTAALGLALRATGRGLKVIMIQFLKGEESGEHIFVSQNQSFEIVRPNDGNCFTQSNEELAVIINNTMALAKEAISSGKYDLVILDEIFITITRGFLSTGDVLDLMKSKPDHVELVLTGRGAPNEVVREADLVSELLMIKHPYTEGIGQRIGIEL